MPFIELVAQRRSPSPPPGMQLPQDAADWYRIENNADDVDATDIYVYESIGGFFGMWAEDFIRDLKQVATTKINLRLNSPGGSVFDGIAIANAIRSHPANVTVYVDSLAASIASVIALSGDRVVMMPQSQFMVHNASGAAFGDASEMTKMADLLDKQSRNIAEAYAQHTGKPLAEWQAYMDAETWFTAEEAVAVGLADEVMPMRPAKEEEAPAASSLAAVMNRAWDLSMFRYAGREHAPEPKAALTVTNEAPEPKDTAPAVEETAASAESIANMTRDELVSLIRDVVQAAMAPAEEPEDAFPPEDEPEDAFPPPKEDEEDPEDANSEDPDAASEEDPEAETSEDPEDAKKKKKPLPPWLKPKKGDEDKEDDPDDEATAEPEDEWAGLVACLTAPSPSADDVFNTLMKEAW